MVALVKFFKRLLYVFASAAGALLLFICLTSVTTGKSLFNSDFHKKLFERNNIYSQIQNVIASSISDFTSEMQKNFPENYEQNKEIFSLLEKALTPDMVKLNADIVREGIFQYFRGEKSFLPDIYINKPAESTDESTSLSDGYATGSPQYQAISKIEKINLGAILLYANRTDITDTLLFIKLFYNINSMIPGFSILLFSILLLIALAARKYCFSFFKWTETVMKILGVLTLVSGAVLMVYAFTLSPSSIYVLAASIPLQSDVIIAYVKDCLLFYSMIFTATGVIFTAAGFSAAKLKFLVKPAGLFLDRLKAGLTPRATIIAAVAFYTTIFALLFSLFFIKYNDSKKTFASADLQTAVTKLKNTNTVTEVISAKDDTIYSLQVKLVDRKTGEPVKNVQIGINGKSSTSSKTYNEYGTTDENGLIKFNLDKGNFRYSFVSSGFPSQYQMPSPSFFDIKEAGTTIITVSLDLKSELENRKWGIIELEVLDPENNPVSGLELTISGNVEAPGQPDSIFSFTNSEGIAVFKVNEGSYKVGFTEEKLPQIYQTPMPVDVTSTNSTVTRYTIRLVGSEGSELRQSKP